MKVVVEKQDIQKLPVHGSLDDICGNNDCK